MVVRPHIAVTVRSAHILTGIARKGFSPVAASVRINIEGIHLKRKKSAYPKSRTVGQHVKFVVRVAASLMGAVRGRRVPGSGVLRVRQPPGAGGPRGTCRASPPLGGLPRCGACGGPPASRRWRGSSRRRTPGARFQLTFPDGSTREGRLNTRGCPPRPPAESSTKARPADSPSSSPHPPTPPAARPLVPALPPWKRLDFQWGQGDIFTAKAKLAVRRTTETTPGRRCEPID